MHRVGARYTYNIFHQSEFALRMAEAALRDGPPAHVVWPFRLLNFTRQLLELFLAQNDLECGKNKDCRYAYRWNAHVHVAADRACRLLGDHARSANRTWPRPVLTLPQLWGSGYWHNPDGEEAAG